MFRLPLAVLLATSTLISAEGFAESLQEDAWPRRAVRVVMPQPAGTGSDFTARLFSEVLAARWGKPVVVENRPGGDGVLGVAAFAATPDDHSLLFSVSAPFALQPLIQPKLAYDPDRDAVPIAMVSDITLVVAVTDALPVRTLPELVSYARAQPGKLNWTAGPGLPRYVFAAFAKRAGLSLTYLSYRELAPAVQDFASGRVHVMVHGFSVVRPQLQAGKARLLAITNQRRAAAAPEAATVMELGFPELAMDGLSGFFGARDLPTARRTRLAHDITAVAADPSVASRLAATGQTLRTSTPEEFADALVAQRRRIDEVVRIVGSDID